MRATVPITRDLLLIGGGHAHAIVLKMWGMKPLPGVRLTLINPDPTAPYTGMLPGLVAGHYQRNALEIDLVRLARFAGARLVLDRVVGLDLAKSRAQLAERPDIAFDLVSIDIGIGSGLAGIDQGQAWPAKPLGAFADAWEAFVAKVIAGTKAPSVAVALAGLNWPWPWPIGLAGPALTAAPSRSLWLRRNKTCWPPLPPRFERPCGRALRILG
jgi:selenide,water dikinase